MTLVGKWTLESYRHSHLAFSLFQKLRQLPLYLLCVPGRIGSSSVCNQNTFFVRRGKNRAVGLLEYSLGKLLRLMSFTENTSFICWLLKSWVLFSFAVLGTLCTEESPFETVKLIGLKKGQRAHRFEEKYPVAAYICFFISGENTCTYMHVLLHAGQLDVPFFCIWEPYHQIMLSGPVNV